MMNLTAKEARVLLAKPKRKNKYGAQKTTIDGIIFDSKREGAYYAALKQRELAGEVTGVEMQRPFALLGKEGELMTTYRADFAFWDNIEGRFRVIDVKGFQTKEFRLKRKLMKGLLGINVEIVK